MMPYILYAAIILTGCVIFYKLLLQKETFFKVNRFALLGFVALAFLLPLIKVPENYSFRKNEAPAVVLPSLLPDQQSGSPALHDNAAPVGDSTSKQRTAISFSEVAEWAVWLYWFGVIVFALNFLVQLVVLLWQAYTKPVIRDGRYRIVEVSGDKAPCSFGNNIFINPEKYEWDTYNQILLHEKIHVKQAHSFDLLIAEIVIIFQWFNPFAWAFRKSVENNLEFLTDSQLLQKPEVDMQSYQVSLLKVSAPHFPLSLTTNYNQSLLKKRIFMMNSKRSNIHTGWKYFFIIPMMVFFVATFSETIAVAQPNNSDNNAVNSSDRLETSGSWFATIKGDKIDIQFKQSEDAQSYNSNTFDLTEFGTLPRENKGTFNLTRDAGVMEFTGTFDGNQGMGQYVFKPNNSYVEFLRSEGIEEINVKDQLAYFLVNVKRSYVQMLKREGFTKLGKGDLLPMAALQVDEAYIKSIRGAGFQNISMQDLVPFRALGVTAAYINEIRKAGYDDLDAHRVISFKAQGIDAKYIADIKNSIKLDKDKNDNGLREEKMKEKHDLREEKVKEKEQKPKKPKDDLDDITAFKALNIDAEFISSIKSTGLKNVTSHELVALKANGVNAEYIKSIQSNFPNASANNIIASKAMGITPALISEYKALGLESIDLNNIISAKATGTTPAFIRSQQEKGHELKTIQKYITLKTVVGES